MTDLYLPSDPKEQTPLVHFKTTGELKIEGKSYPENPMRFYTQVMEWIKDLKTQTVAKIEMTVCLDYFNTSTSKIILSIFKNLESMYLTDKKDVKIIWLYNSQDEDMTESGKDYGSLLDVPYEMREI